MDNNTTEAVVQEKKGYGTLLVLITVIALLFAGWYFLSNQKTAINQISDETPDELDASLLAETITLDGTVESIDLAKNELTIQASTVRGGVMNNENIETNVKERLLRINQGTIIQKLIISKGDDGAVNRSAGIEMNLSDLREGDKISVIYNGLAGDRELNNVKNISAVFVTDDFEKKYQTEYDLLQASAVPVSYVKGRVLSVNGTNIEYSLYAFNKLGADKHVAVIQSDAKFYTINDPARVGISHAKKTVSIEEVKAGSDIFIATNGNALTGEVIEIKEIIVVSNE